ncbi:MAG: galactose oxidase [Alteromonadaceae bacterium]|nr:galactose oxidase [Alteromonadaceae bacterium]|tara:strand:- start:8875 stop:10002 length:1128 start_codon:yes stop_codon:yes gene_type:complete
MLFNIRFILLLSLPVFISACVSRPPAPSDTNTEVVVETSVEHNQVKDVSNAGNGAGPKIKQQQTSSKESASQKNAKDTRASSDKSAANEQPLRLQTARFAHASATDGKLLYVFAGYGKQGYLSDVEIINPQTGQSSVLANKVLARGYFSAVFDQQHSIYLLGGIGPQPDDVRVEQRIEVFDTRTHETRVIGNIPEPLKDNKAVYLNGYIYVLGGASYHAANGYQLIPSDALWRFDIKQQEWQKMANLPSAKSTEAVVHNNTIYAVGGEQNSENLAAVERYDITSNTWHTMAALPHPVSAHSVAWLNNALWVFADEDQHNNSYVLHDNATKWQATSFDYQSALYTSVNTLGNSLYVIGGNAGKGNSFMRLIQVFTP